MAEEELIVRGLTGIDLRMRVAGPGTRSYAFLTDWLLRTLLALGWLLAAALVRLLPAVLRIPRLPKELLGAAAILALLTYFLYHPVLEVAMQGRTPGLRKAGARIVTVEGATPGTGALLLRNVFRLIDCLPVCYVVGLAFTLFTPQRVRLGDMVAGTVLVLDEREAAESLGRLAAQLERTTLSVEALQLIHDLLERWRSLQERQRTQLARELLGKLDPGFTTQGETGPALRSRLEALLAGPRR